MPAAVDGDIFTSLNKAQCRAVSSSASTVAILAGPGSGKTHTITSRIVWLVDHVGIPPCNVIVATFTVKASNEMKARIGQALGDGREKKIVLGTFHSIARRYLAAYGQQIGLNPKFSIADDSDSRGIIQRICKRLDIQLEPAMARAWISKRKAKGTSDEKTIVSKNGKAIESQAFEQCFQEYQDHLERSNLLDYDDLLVRCVELLREFPFCVSNIQAVLVDEYQDTNGIQYDLMKLFAQRSRKITIVGDPDQSIYGWRSAEIRNLHRFLRDFPGTDEVALEENYRSSSSILDVSLQVIQRDDSRYKKVLLPVHEKGTRPVLRTLKSSTVEADWIVSEIKRVKLMSGSMINLDDVAILLRSASLSRHVESALGREGIPYRMVGGFKFYERAEIKMILDYLRIIHQPDNNDALARIINVPKRGIGDQTIKNLLEEAERNSMSLWKLLLQHCRGNRTAKTTIRKQAEQKLGAELIRLINGIRAQLHSADGTPIRLVEIIEKLIRDLHLRDHLEETYAEHESRWANVQEFVSLAADFTSGKSQVEEALPDIEGIQQSSEDDILTRFLANVSLASDKQTDDKDAEGKPMVTISTIHAAKGLEWPVVFIPAVYQGSIPHMRSEDEAEERRLLYVAMTRAKALLYLSFPLHVSNGGGDGGVQLSPFIECIPSSNFLKKGPSFDRKVMADISRILRRDLQSEQSIYKNMPLMELIEDNRFPVDPKQDHANENENVSSNAQFTALNKRRKLQHTSGATQIDAQSVDGWSTPYATTMERSASFTVPQAPKAGFTTAAAHHASTAAEEKKTAATAPIKSLRTSTNNPRTVQRPVQRSLLGYGYGITNHDKSKLEDVSDQSPPLRPTQNAPYPSRKYFPRNTGPQRQQLPPAMKSQPNLRIEPSLASHKLGSAKLTTKPTQAPREASRPSKHYTCFSSSPNRPTPEAPDSESAEKENVVPPEEQVRPAASFHATTVNGPLGGRGGGIKRPAPLADLGRSGIAPMDRLKKPFKLTVKRP
ncbi:hypothetical protein DL766_003295 [Monosporascus sp. MC13-8B]|uniref:DNA 3'-5' helicase n=1 Tax=Monosporascus cannonballus TaxID=155416 RepID=A0ABY0GRM6_9PEZI|nr:hypothetical protein DL762_010087 [Monosporascus cannonballus]RYO93306.1 hypothetical protein DL763_004405 [Monosporascus cannonballus]RYP33802.1 hypothetical protein DL766_003295 [Monosporascus sp. MC13-8B]